MNAEVLFSHTVVNLILIIYRILSILHRKLTRESDTRHEQKLDLQCTIYILQAHERCYYLQNFLFLIKINKKFLSVG